MAPFAEGTGPSEPGVGGQGGKGAIDPLPQIFGRNRSKAFFPQKALFYRLSPWIFKPSYTPEEEEERKEALTLAHIRVHIFVSKSKDISNRALNVNAFLSTLVAPRSILYGCLAEIGMGSRL